MATPSTLLGRPRVEAGEKQGELRIDIARATDEVVHVSASGVIDLGPPARVLAGQVDVDEIVAAADGLARFGLASDATRLAGQAALQTQDPKVSGLMLQAARDLKPHDVKPGDDADAETSPDAAERRRRPVSTTLSDREREVAELLLLGMPYRDIGAQLFISAKTVEHHVARIRRRLGADSRSEMLSMLRALLAPDHG